MTATTDASALPNHVFVVHGDITEVCADAIAYSTTAGFSETGDLYTSFAARVPGFREGLQSLRARGEKVYVGDAFWFDVPKPASDGRRAPLPQGVVVVASVGAQRDGREPSRQAVESAIRAALKHLPSPAPDGRLLVALPAFLMGRGGGHGHLLTHARTQLDAARAVLADCTTTPVDVVFVAYTEPVYHAFLQARRALGMVPALEPQARPLVEALRRNECVLFVGAGLSSAAGLHSWERLVRALEKHLGVSEREGRGDFEYYLDLAQWYREASEELKLAPLAEVVAREFGDTRDRSRPTLGHYLLAALPVRMVVTTNYDDLLERTFDALRRPYLRIVEQQDVPESGTTDRTCVVKFHGDAAAGEALVLSRDDYDTFFQNRPAMALLLEGLLLNQTFFFVGYSLRDPNFRQIFSRIAAMLRDARRPAFATTVDPYPPQAARQWERKRLSLLSPGGGSSNARAHAVLRWLDALGDSVEPPNSVFLTRDAGDDSDAALAAVRQALHRVGDAVESAVKSGVDAACARQLAPVLEFLASRGWRPRSTRLSFVWERLADAVPEDDREHARWLDRALQTSEKLDDVRRLRSHALRHDSDAGDRGAVGSKPSAPPHQ